MVYRQLDLSGSISEEMPVLSGELEDAGECAGKLPGEVVTYIPEIDAYEGSTTVTPAAEPQMLETKGKTMEDNVTVEGIPVWEVTNNSGGITVNIGRYMM